MLQWMGGARRKVASSRMSTLKRQKQYFEQKRRQQHATEGRNDTEMLNIHGQNTKNSRSLDILSLQNLSTVVQENKPSQHLGRNDSEDDVLNYQALKCPQPVQIFQTYNMQERNDSEVDVLNYQALKCPQPVQKFQANKFTPSSPSEVEEARPSSSYLPGNASSKAVLVSTSGKDVGTSNSDYDKTNQCKMVSEYQDMMDILGDDEPNVHAGSSLEREAYAAFSIEGVGKVEMETPVHTPVRGQEVHARTFLHGCSPPPSKAMKPAYSCELNSELVNLESDLDAILQEVDVPLCRNSARFSFSSKDILGSFGNQKKDLLDTREFSLFDDNDNGFSDLFPNDEPFFPKTERNMSNWDATCRPLPGNILEDCPFGLSCKNWMDLPDASDDYYSMDCRRKEFSFQGSYQQRSRPTRRTSERVVGCRDSPELFAKHQKSENFHDSTIPEMKWRSPVQRDHDVDDIDYQDAWSSFITEDTRDNLSLLSEESCSSSAAAGILKKGTLNSKEKQTRKSAEFGCPENVFSEKNLSGREKTCNKFESDQQGEKSNRPGKFTGGPNLSRSQPADNPYMTPEKRLKSKNGGLLERACDLGKTTSGHNPHPILSETTNFSSSSSRLWIDDLFVTIGDTNLNGNCSPFCNLTPKKHDSRKPKLEKVMPVPSMLLSEHSNRGYEPQISLNNQRFPESGPQSISKEEDEHSCLHASDHGKLEPTGDSSRCRKSLFSESRKFIYEADAEDKSGNCKDSTNGTSKLSTGFRMLTCAADAEDKSSNCKECTHGSSKAGENARGTGCLQDEEETSSSGTAATASRSGGESCHEDTEYVKSINLINSSLRSDVRLMLKPPLRIKLDQE